MDGIAPDRLLDQVTLLERIRSGNPLLIPNRIQRAALHARALAGAPNHLSRKDAVQTAQQSYNEFTCEQIDAQLTRFES